MVLPAHGKSFEQFQSDDALCRQWARQQIGMSPQETVNQNAVTGAAVGTAVGAGLGAAIGAASGRAGAGAAIGAASGLAVGASSGASAGQVYGWEAQRRYDISYQQCMYAKGNVIPGNRRIRRTMPPPPPPPPDYEYEQPEAVGALPGTFAASATAAPSGPVTARGGAREGENQFHFFNTNPSR